MKISEMWISIMIFHNLCILYYLFRPKDKERSKSIGTVDNTKKDNTPKCKSLSSTLPRGTKHNQTHL